MVKSKIRQYFELTCQSGNTSFTSGSLAEELQISGLTWLSFMKKNAELSGKSYLLKSLESISVYKLMVNTFNGFFCIEFDPNISNFGMKHVTIFIQICFVYEDHASHAWPPYSVTFGFLNF